MLIKISSVAYKLLVKKFDTNSKLLKLPKYTKTDDWGIWLFFYIPQGHEQVAKPLIQVQHEVQFVLERTGLRGSEGCQKLQVRW